MNTSNSSYGQPALRVLMQIRPNALMQRGGDTVVMENLAAGLRARGIEVTVDVDGRANPKDYDVVHLFNFALPEHTKMLGMKAYEAGTPFVVTTLYEEVSKFHNQSTVAANRLVEYVNRGQNREWWNANKVDFARVTPSGTFDNHWTAEHAAALFTNGGQESKAIRRDYPNASATIEIKLGHEVGVAGDAALFEQAYGVKDFVLCVGRFESRKNQLMLLKALEDSDITVVLCGGGFTYQPDYDRAVRNFKRQGKTIVLDRISPQMLASAYAAAKVHALPSWYELPGLVSLEAAHHGCNVVAADSGTTPDYFGDLAFYCDPSSERSIFNAVMAAYFSPLQSGLRERAMSYTWAQTIEQTAQAYDRVMAGRQRKGTNQPQQPAYAPPSFPHPISSQPTTPAFSNVELTNVIERGEAAAMNEQYQDAHELLAQAERMDPHSSRALKARGTVFLAEGKTSTARGYFERAHTANPADPRPLSGLAMCEMREQRVHQAYTLFVKALDIDPMHLTSLLQLMECAYNLLRFDDLERVLRNYLVQRPADVEMRFCLAGCCYKQGKFDEAAHLADDVLRERTDHQGARELKEAIRQRPAAPRTNPVVNSMVQSAAATSSEPFDGIDRQIMELEEAKRERRLDDVRSGCQRLAAIGSIKPAQAEKIKLLQAEVFVLEENLVAAKSIYDQVLAQNPQSARGLCGQGALAAHAGRWDDARNSFERALIAKPEYDVALAGMGLCCSWFKEHERAWDFYKRAVRTNPENARALLGIIELGYPLKRLIDVESAVRAYLDMHPLDFEFLYALAGCLYAQGKLDEATAEVRKITMFEPDNQRARELQRLIDERTTQPGRAQVVAGR